MKTNNQIAFSLTEISVTLIVIGFILAGVFKGQTLIAAAKLKAVIAESAEQKIAINGFYSQYDQLPGDFDDASSFWSSASNGNGNGQLKFLEETIHEGYVAWQHMSYARVLDDPYVGTETTGAAVINTDIPGSRVKGAGYFLDYGNFGFTNSNQIILGAPIANATNAVIVSGALSAKEAYDIDSKSDDGNPSAGTIHAKDGEGSTSGFCVNNNSTPGNNADDLYNLPQDGLHCTIAFEVVN